MRAGLGSTLFLAALAVAAFGASGAGAAARSHTIVIDKMKFGPLPTGLKVGDLIVWVNRDMFRHTATARDKSFDVDLPAGKSGRLVLRKPGTIAFFCRFHPGMTGQLQVGR
jgi:plastocyanin